MNKSNSILDSLASEFSMSLDILLVVNDDDGKHFSGTITLLKYNCKFWGICTAHQLKTISDTSKIVVGLTDLSSGAATSSSAKRIIHPDLVDGAAGDLVALDFTEAVSKGYLKSDRFHEVDPNAGQGGDYFGFLAMGYPFEENYAIFGEAEDPEGGDIPKWSGFQAGLKIIHCKIEEGSKHDLDSERFSSLGGKTFSPNGMSGGLVCGITMRQDGSIKKTFEGMIYMGGNGIFHVLNVQAILRVLDQY